MELELFDHSDHNLYSHNSHLYCEDAYCREFIPFVENGAGLEIANGTAVGTISLEQCLDMCLCDEDCIISIWALFACSGDDLPFQCAMCRLFHHLEDESNPLSGFTGYGNNGYQSEISVVAAKNQNHLVQPTNICLLPEACESPVFFSGSSALSNVDNSQCDVILSANTTRKYM